MAQSPLAAAAAAAPTPAASWPPPPLPPPRAPAARPDMSEADRVPSPAAPPAVAASAPEEKKGKEPEREKLPPIVSAGASAPAVGAGRGPRGAPTAGREGGEGRPGTRFTSREPRTRPGRSAQAALPRAEIEELCLEDSRDHFSSCTFHPRGMPGWPSQLAVFGHFRVWGLPSFSKEMTSILESIVSWMRIRCQASGSGFSAEPSACRGRAKISPLFFAFSFRSPFRLNRL